jgi:hypothetical protein
MKKLFSILVIALAFFNNAKAQVQYPFGPASFPTVTVTSKVTAQAITINNLLTYIDLGTIDTNKVLTVSGAANYSIKKGAMLFIKATSDGTARSLTPSTGFTGVALSGTASKIKVMQFIYDGAHFIECSTPIQIN